MSTEGRRLLLCQLAFERFAGSEMVSLELIEWFADRGWGVDLFTTVFGEPLAAHVEGLVESERLRVVLLSDESEVSAHDYDLIWVHHSLLPTSIVREVASGSVRTPIVWHHMSSFVAQEMPLLAEIEDAAASIVTAMSPVALEKISEFGFDPSRLSLFDNPAPSEFATYEGRVSAESLSSLLVVSNHPPMEVTHATDELRSMGISVTIAGSAGTYSRITPETLNPHDAVITIGKTTQYALVMGIPVFSYDHFGGGGWITQENLEKEHYGNFAGRLERRMLSAEQLVEEIRSGYSAARQFAVSYRPQAVERWDITKQLKRLLDDPRLGDLPRPLSTRDAVRAIAACEQRDYLWTQFRGLQRRMNAAIEVRDERVRLLKEELEAKDEASQGDSVDPPPPSNLRSRFRTMRRR